MNRNYVESCKVGDRLRLCNAHGKPEGSRWTVMGRAGDRGEQTLLVNRQGEKCIPRRFALCHRIGRSALHKDTSKESK